MSRFEPSTATGPPVRLIEARDVCLSFGATPAL